MSTLALRYHKEHPYRLVDWRWQRARALQESKKRPSKRFDDNWIAEALRFRAKLERCKDDEDRYELFDEMREIYLAYELHDESEELMREFGTSMPSSGNKSHPGRFEIEARLLAQQSHEEIALRMHTLPSAIAAYEAIFFNVSDRIRSPGYITQSVIGPAIHRGLSDREYDTLWKLFGYIWGKAAIDELATTFELGKPHHIDAARLGTAWIEDTQRTMQRKSALAARSLSINSYTQIQVLEMHARYTEIEQSGQATSALASDFLANMAACLDSVPWLVGAEEASRMDARVLPYYDGAHGGVEPRAEQILMLGNGQEVVIEQGVTFPESTPEQKEMAMKLFAQEAGGPKPGGVTEPAKAIVGRPQGIVMGANGAVATNGKSNPPTATPGAKE